MTRLLGVAALACLVGCAARVPTARVDAPLIPADVGYVIGGTGLEISFGRAEAGAVAAASRILGRPTGPVSVAPGCVRYTWADGVTMDIRDGAFAGWTAPPGRAAAPSAGRPCSASPSPMAEAL